MRILMMSVDFLPTLGGVSMMTHHLANALVDHGHDVFVVAPEKPLSACLGPERNGLMGANDLPRRYTVIPDTHARPDRKHGSAWLRAGEAERVAALLRSVIVRREVERVLVMHPHYYGPAALTAARALGVPVSVYVHGSELTSLLTTRHTIQSLRQDLRGLGPSLRRLTCQLARDADEILVNSRFTARAVRRTGTRRRIVVTGCGLARADFAALQSIDPSAKRAARARFGLPHDGPVVGTVARLVASKNVAMLLRGLQARANVRAMVVGAGPERSALQALATDLGVADRVVWTGCVREDDKRAAYAAMDVFCLLSKPQRDGAVEGFGIVLLEAAAAGLPIIATRTGGMADLIRHEQTGLVVRVGDTPGLSSAIDRLLGDHALRETLVREAQRQIRARYNWPHIADALVRQWSVDRG